MFKKYAIVMMMMGDLPNGKFFATQLDYCAARNLPEGRFFAGSFFINLYKLTLKTFTSAKRTTASGRLFQISINLMRKNTLV